MSERIGLLTHSMAVEAFAALRELHRVCHAMDGDLPGPAPTDKEYQAAMRQAAAVLRPFPAKPQPRKR